jgi:branched-chain amino acid aminotransferase
MQQIQITRAQALKTHPAEDKLGFGTIFTDHMFLMDHNAGQGWANPRIVPFGPISMLPSTSVLHYAQAVFEGLKAYRTANGSVQLFRPRDNMARLNKSCGLLCIPPIDEAFALNALRELVKLEKAWVPGADGTSLYIRPAIIAMDQYIGVKAADSYLFFIILSPVGAYYKEGLNPVKIWVSEDRVRAVRGGVGEAKTAGNYAASLLAGKRAAEAGYTQVLWLDGVERKFVEEVGSMNIFFVIDNKLVTPALQGSILPGITRDSVIRLAHHWGIPVEERKVSIDELFEADAQGKLQECFGTGTAAVVSPVGELKFQDKIMKITNGQIGEMTMKFYNALTDIQYGRSPDPFGWIEPVE